MANLRRIVIVAGSVTIACATAYLYVVPPHKSPERFGLIPDLPLEETSVSKTANSRTDLVGHDQVRTAIRQRLLAAYRTLAYADSGKWHLATWAQLQWVRDTLDGAGLQNIQAGTRLDPSLQDFSFVRLLNELVRIASPDQKQVAMDARRDGTAIIEELTAMTPNTKDPTATLKHVVLEIESSPGLQPFVTDFPRFKEIPLPTDDF
jgi:hypothetical protein